MTRDRLLIKDVSSGIPATWHRNTLSIFGTSNDSTSASSAPSQLVHPDGSFNVGLAVDSVQLDHRGARIPDHDNGSDEQQTLMVYASADEGSKHDVVRHHPVMITVLLFYLLLTLWLGPLAMKAPEATYRTTILVSICCASLLDLFLVVGVLWRFGFFDTMNLNTTMLSFLILVLLLHRECRGPVSGWSALYHCAGNSVFSLEVHITTVFGLQILIVAVGHCGDHIPDHQHRIHLLGCTLE